MVYDTNIEMENAGASALKEEMGTINPGALFNYFEVAKRIYLAMRDLEPKKATPFTMTLKLDTTDFERQIATLQDTIAEFKAAIDAVQVAE